MMPNVIAPAATCRQIITYCLFLVPVSFAPLVFAGSGLVYAAIVAVLNGILIVHAAALYGLRDGPEADRSKAAMALFGFSILYMFVFFVVMLAQALTK